MLAPERLLKVVNVLVTLVPLAFTQLYAVFQALLQAAEMDIVQVL
jgi:hypothetical protein